MLVNHGTDHITHAIIGAKKVQTMTFDDTGHLADTLSKALYSDKPRAVVREVHCNAWDIQIETGRTNIPVKVTVTNEELIIRDFGVGIHNDEMGPRYGTYGGSTKEKDSRFTGGLGTDHTRS